MCSFFVHNVLFVRLHCSHRVYFKSLDMCAWHIFKDYLLTYLLSAIRVASVGRSGSHGSFDDATQPPCRCERSDLWPVAASQPTFPFNEISARQTKPRCRVDPATMTSKGLTPAAAAATRQPPGSVVRRVSIMQTPLRQHSCVRTSSDDDHHLSSH